MQYDERYRRPADDPRAAAPEQPAQPYMVGVPMAYPMIPEGGGVMYVNGVPQPLGRRSSKVLIGAIVFATCVLPLIILAVVFFMMPDFDSMFGGYQVPEVPTISVPAVPTPPR